MRSCVVALSIVGALVAAPRSAEAKATRWHVDVDATYLRGSVKYLTVPVPNIQCLTMDCRVTGVERMDVGRLHFGLGYGTLTLEGSVAVPVREEAPYRALSAGFRLQTSADAVIALAFRFAYVRSTVRGIDGQGGRAGVGLVLNFHAACQLYAEASIEASTVSSALNETGTMLSYAPLVGAGLRMSLR
jgi:hypothetical protein